MENLNGKKKTMGRRKIEIKKIEKKSSLQVAFTKRRGGLFRKASEIAVYCGAEMAILVQSPGGKLFSYGQPSVRAVVDRVDPTPATEAGRIPCEYEGRVQYEEAKRKLETEVRIAAEREIEAGLWWEEPDEGLELHQLEELLKSLEDFCGEVAERLSVYPPQLSLPQTSSSIHNYYTFISKN
ncbi:hypothetical protein SASPL_105139 [Salvia splendens]|uniref:MADS-box domain-containing protein n=1 Tax=Salvia splendens TaxID=180675 RepID=A0A8X8YKR5_SALSN|nr:agamous-like MADS-box protein AGL62 [Salvia splendens]KAG6433525.1 hypothetical protein SASPL_105139 [Salvia splendens]